MATVATTEPGISNVTQSEPLLTSPASRSKDSTDTLTSHILLFSFVAAVLLAIGGFVVVAVYLFQYLHHAFQAFDKDSIAQMSGIDISELQTILLARAGLWKFILQSCGIIAGVAFGFLGFGLFLLGAKGDMDASFADSQHKVQLSRMAPGSFVILIAAGLIGVCSIHKVELKYDPAIETNTEAGGGMNMGISVNDPASNPNALPHDPSAYVLPMQTNPGQQASPAVSTPRSKGK
jgi:hypothetical protein